MVGDGGGTGNEGTEMVGGRREGTLGLEGQGRRFGLGLEEGFTGMDGRGMTCFA